MEIRTERLLLRRPRMDDLEPMFEILCNPEAMRYWSTLPHANLETTHGWLERALQGQQQFIIEMEGRAIGEIGAGRLPDFGFIIHPDFWGKGIATEASEAVIAHIFSETDADCLKADVDPRNGASLHVLARLGFVETGRASNTFLLGEEWCDSIYLTLQRPPERG